MNNQVTIEKHTLYHYLAKIEAALIEQLKTNQKVLLAYEITEKVNSLRLQSNEE